MRHDANRENDEDGLSHREIPPNPGGSAIVVFVVGSVITLAVIAAIFS